MKRFAPLVAALSALVAAPLAAQVGAPPPVPVKVAVPAEPGAIPLYPDVGNAGTEQWEQFMGTDVVVRNVTRPTLTPVFPARGKANGAAVVVAPGGAFMLLAMEHEGWNVARALAARGITAFVLKYRLVQTPADGMDARQFMSRTMMQEVAAPMDGALLKQSLAPADARAALAMVRTNAGRWHIDPARVGIIGFSAGAMTSRRVAIDAPAAERPAFVGYIYGPQDAETVPADAPPLFDAIALDDGLFPNKGFAIAQSWREAKRPVEIHGYQQGNHGFGLGQPGSTNALMLDEFVAWLSMQGFLTRKDAK
ncbi:MAG: alpha/beta hydrolase fold domain-containing protein [Sphingomonadales bacterium]|nr:alpha/beta hydrolase fold domain-containing protein [Sphingomonadales bacterium]